MTFEFADTEESKIFFDHNPSFFPFLEKLIAASNSCFARTPKQKNYRNHLEDVVFSQGHKCRDDYNEIVFLATSGYADGAVKILRGLYERVVTIAYIGDNNEMAKKFMKYGVIQEHRVLQAALTLFTLEQLEVMTNRPEWIAEVQKAYGKVKPDFQMTLCKQCGTTRTQPSWDIDFAAMVKKVGDPFGMFYMQCYANTNLQIHATTASGFDGQDRDSPEYIKQRRHECNMSLYAASCLFIEVMRMQSKTFDLKMAEELNDCETAMKPWEKEIQAAAPDASFLNPNQVQ